MAGLGKNLEIFQKRRFFRSLSLVSVPLTSAVQNYALKSISSNSFTGCTHGQYHNQHLRHFSASIRRKKNKISSNLEGSSGGVLLTRLESAIMDHRVDAAWKAFNEYKTLYGFPKKSLLNGLITEMSYSSNIHWLQKACDLVLCNVNRKSVLFEPKCLAKLSLSLSRAHMPIPTSKILRLMMVRNYLPPISVLSLIFLHMVKSEVGAYLLSNLLIQICGRFESLNQDRSNCAKLFKPDTMIFNILLDACVRYELSLKGQQIIELMARVGVIADAHSIVIIAQLHEMNGQRDEVKKLKDCVDCVYASFLDHYRHFYDSLLSLHFKFNDVDAASRLVLDLCRSPVSLPIRNDRMDLHKHCLVSVGSPYLKMALKIEVAPEVLHKDSVLKVESKQELFMVKNGKLLVTNKGLAKLIYCCKSSGRVTDLSKLIVTIQKESYSLQVAGFCSDVLNACIHLIWLETAHDILDDMESERAHLGYASYMSLLKAYCREKKFRDAEALLKQMRKIGFAINMSDKAVISFCLTEAVPTLSVKSKLDECLLWEMQKDKKEVPPVVYELNSSIYFFCRAKMIEDASKTYRRLCQGRIQPTIQTFANLVYGYSSWGMYREIIFLWGDIKRNLERGNSVVNRDLCEFMLLNFLRGGYFERVMEIINYMNDLGMYTDKWMYRCEFLKFHQDLYINLKASMARTVAQSKRIEFVQAFRKWVSSD